MNTNLVRPESKPTERRRRRLYGRTAVVVSLLLVILLACVSLVQDRHAVNQFFFENDQPNVPTETTVRIQEEPVKDGSKQENNGNEQQTIHITSALQQEGPAPTKSGVDAAKADPKKYDTVQRSFGLEHSNQNATRSEVKTTASKINLPPLVSPSSVHSRNSGFSGAAQLHNQSVTSLTPTDFRETHADYLSCMKASGFQFANWTSASSKYKYRVMSTVQALAREPIGFAARCDWVIGSRRASWKIKGYSESKNQSWGDVHKLPRTIFLQTDKIGKFDLVLRCFPSSHRFVLIVGDSDATTPRQVDVRAPSPLVKPNVWQEWLADPRILHLFIEHLDTPSPVDRVTPIPLGLNPKDANNPDKWLDKALSRKSIEILKKEVSMAFTNRIRTGPQWSDRAKAKQMCDQLKHCSTPKLQPPRYFEGIQKFTFLLCVHGGGIDPNPNLFTALLAGVIPIIAPFASLSMYEGLPIVVTDGRWDVESDYFSKPYLAKKLVELAPYFEDPQKRASVVERLTSKFWWDKVLAASQPDYSNGNRSSHAYNVPGTAPETSTIPPAPVTASDAIE